MKKPIWLMVLVVFLLVKLILHFYLNEQWFFHRDELLYLALGRHLDWGYASVPPGIGFWAWIGESILGGSVWAVRLISTLFGTATVLLTALMAKEILPEKSESGKFAMFIIGLSGIICGAFLRPSMLFMPVVFDVFYWTLLCWIFIKYLKSYQSTWLLWFGVAAGLGLLNKYTVLIFLFGMLPGILIANRRIFSTRNFYFGVGLGLLIFSPNLVWHVKKGFPVIRHMTELASSQFAHVSMAGFFGDQMLFFLPALPIWFLGLYFLLFKKEAADWRGLGWMFLTVLLVLLLFSAKSYYSLGAYPVLVAAGAAYMERQTVHQLRWLRFALPGFMLIVGITALPASLPLLPPQQEANLMKKMAITPGLQGILRWEDGNYHTLPQDYADMIGWEELGNKAAEIWQNIPDKTKAAIYADNYGQAGAVEYFGKKFAVTGVFSFSDNYRYWLPESLPADFHTLIYINDELGDDMPGFFQKIEKVWELDMPLSRQHGDQIYLCQQPTAAFFDRINKAIQAAKNDEEIED